MSSFFLQRHLLEQAVDAGLNLWVELRGGRRSGIGNGGLEKNAENRQHGRSQGDAFHKNVEILHVVVPVAYDEILNGTGDVFNQDLRVYMTGLVVANSIAGAPAVYQQRVYTARPLQRL